MVGNAVTAVIVLHCLAFGAVAESVRPLSEVELKDFAELSRGTARGLGDAFGAPDLVRDRLDLRPEHRRYGHATAECVVAMNKSVYLRFDRNTKELLQAINLRAIDHRCAQEGEGLRIKTTLSDQKRTELARLYLRAIEGREAEGPDCVLSDKLRGLAKSWEQGTDVGPMEDAYFFWCRVYRTFPFRDDYKAVMIYVSDGAFVTYERYYESQQPDSVDVNFTDGDAFSAAKDGIKKEIAARTTKPVEPVLPKTVPPRYIARPADERKSITLPESCARYITVEPVEEKPPCLMIVNPNNAYTQKYRGHDPENWTPRTRLAWVFNLAYADPTGEADAAPSLSFEIWVDAATGKVIGGYPPY
jgi:hypothetical protein